LDYVAEYWGTPVMILSGLILWFPGAAAGIMPGWVIESAHFVHQGEGLLAILVIFTWHIYTVHFSPDFFPMNRVWLTGKVSREVMKKEYPLELARLDKGEGTNVGR
jgi:cytochrome b subunit of formate dehydrogenase